MKIQDGISIDMSESEYYAIRKKEADLKKALENEKNPSIIEKIKKDLSELSGLIVSKIFIDY